MMIKEKQKDFVEKKKPIGTPGKGSKGKFKVESSKKIQNVA